MRVSLEPCFLLHRRNWRDNSLLLELLSSEHGRVGVVARGARHRQGPLLQPFRPLLVSWSGKSELVSLNDAEENGLALLHAGPSLISGLYINELLVRLTSRNEPHHQLYALYELLLHRLADGEGERALRYFEKGMLRELGYSLPLSNEANAGPAIAPELTYHFQPGLGATRCPSDHPLRVADTEQLYFERGGDAIEGVLISGATLLALAEERLADRRQLKEAKLLMRLVLAPLLGNRPLKSRELSHALLDYRQRRSLPAEPADMQQADLAR
jgi:DNA repair protein RecO (recombination protein O)